MSVMFGLSIWETVPCGKAGAPGYPLNLPRSVTTLEKTG
jgi:hypothetical protein